MGTTHTHGTYPGASEALLHPRQLLLSFCRDGKSHTQGTRLVVCHQACLPELVVQPDRCAQDPGQRLPALRTTDDGRRTTGSHRSDGTCPFRHDGTKQSVAGRQRPGTRIVTKRHRFGASSTRQHLFGNRHRTGRRHPARLELPPARHTTTIRQLRIVLPGQHEFLLGRLRRDLAGLQRRAAGDCPPPHRRRLPLDPMERQDGHQRPGPAVLPAIASA